MSDSNDPVPRLPKPTPTTAIIFSAVLSVLFVLKGNTFNVECVGCLYDPVGANNSVPMAETPTVITKTGKGANSSYDCNVLIPRPFPDAPKTPQVTADLMRGNNDRVIPILTGYVVEQKQFIRDYERHVEEMISRHNTLCK